MSKFFNYIRSHDAVTKSACVMLHYEKDLKAKNILGGIMSIVVKCIVLNIAVNEGIRMFYQWDPSIKSQEKTYENDDYKLHIINASKPLLEIW